jgi:GntR family transcriptional regulator
MAKKEEMPLYQKVRSALMEEIRSMRPGNNRLEPEEQLARRYGTSRATVREALADLIKDGYITPWQGRGNFGHPHALNLNMRFDITYDFVHMLQDSYLEIDVEQSGISLAVPNEDLLVHMPQFRHTQVFAFDWVYTADGEPVIVCRVQVIKAAMRLMLSKRKDEMRLTDYLRRFYDGDITYATAWFKAGLNSEVAGIFEAPAGTPMQMWEEIFYDLYDRQICFNQVYFHPYKTDLSMLLRTR